MMQTADSSSASGPDARMESKLPSTGRDAIIAMIACSALCGLAWGHEGDAATLYALSIGVPVLCSMAGNRQAAFAVALAYYLAGSRGLAPGAAVFFGADASPAHGVALWIGAASVNALTWAACHTSVDRYKPLCAVAGLLLTAFGPAGLVGFVNPLTAAGLLYPGLGVAGLFLLMALIATMTAIAHKPTIIKSGLVAVLVCQAALANVMYSMTQSDDDQPLTFAGQNTNLDRLASGDVPTWHEESKRMARVRSAMDSQADHGQVLVLPETVIPPLRNGSTIESELNALSDKLEADGLTVLAGAELHRAGQHPVNAVLVLGSQHIDQPRVLAQRMPVPVSMWRPWDNDERSFFAHVGWGVHQVRGHRVGLLVCYEQVLTWPAVLTVAHGVDVMVGVANVWWARDTSVPAIQTQAANAWARLAGVPVALALNK